MNRQVWVDVEKIKRLLFAIIAVLLSVTLVVAAGAHNLVNKVGEDGSYIQVENPIQKQLPCEDAPTGVINEYQFALKNIGHDDTLAFYINHHNIAVYIDEKCVYSVTENGEAFRTSGGVWAMIPLEQGDAGKTVRVELYPLYSDYQEEKVDFFIGSALAIYEANFYKALPELFLSLCVVLTGLFLLGIAVYFSIKHSGVLQLYAVGLLSLFAGIWRFTYGRFAYLLLKDQTVLVFTLSVTSLMMVALSMLNCAETGENKKAQKAISVVSVIYCLIYAAQLILQITGVLDLRQMLRLTHVTIILSAVVLGISGTMDWFRNERKRTFFGRNYSWLLGAGALIDLMLYYLGSTAYSMLFTLSAILCFSLLEGIRLLIGFTERKNEMREMETQLTLSRTTVMMSQIRSHFVFNILNAISGMCKYDPEKADDTVVRFARYLRNNIDIMENDKNVSFSTELQHLEDYVVLEQVRFGDKISFYTDIETERFELPPLILQPVVENAIKHGIGKKVTNGTIVLRTREKEKTIVITVEDDGVGFDMKELDKEQSVGLRNIRFRLQHLMGGELDITSAVGEGTTVTITIPKENDQCI